MTAHIQELVRMVRVAEIALEQQERLLQSAIYAHQNAAVVLQQRREELSQAQAAPDTGDPQ